MRNAVNTLENVHEVSDARKVSDVRLISKLNEP